jgi:hypothetical protein
MTGHEREGRRMTAQHDSRIRRSLRRFMLGSGPVKRRSDRIQAIGRLVVVLSFLVAPVVAVAAVTATTARLEAVAASEAADRSRTVAVLLEAASGPVRHSGGDFGSAPTTAAPVRAEWPLPGGTSREGLLVVERRAPIGAAVPVWIDGNGDPTSAPLDRSSIPATATAAGVFPLIGLPVLTWILYACLVCSLDAVRARAWEREWDAVEPDWNSRLL